MSSSHSNAKKDPALWRDSSNATPWRITDTHDDILALAEEAVVKIAILQQQSSPALRTLVAEQLRWANCYYSNRIEGHDTHLGSIADVMKGKLATKGLARDRQIEARIHIHTEKWMRATLVSGRMNTAAITSERFLKILHRCSYRDLPEHMLLVTSQDEQLQDHVSPGKLRHRSVSVGAHTPPAHDCLPAFLREFDTQYARTSPTKAHRLISIACAHHRLLWIHPFMDGNGRVARLHTQALLDTAGLGANGLWSFARGMARSEAQYKSMLMAADQCRLNDYDGRGNLSHKHLKAWCQFFIERVHDQVDYMTSVLENNGFIHRLDRIVKYFEHQKLLHENSSFVINKLATLGPMARSEVKALFGKQNRTQTRAVSKLKHMGLITSKNNKAPIELNINPSFIQFLIPGLYPDNAAIHNDMLPPAL